MKIRPLHDRVIVKRLEEERTSPGGILIPDTAAEKPVQGKIVAVGKGKILDDGQVRALDVKIGDKILFGKYSGTEVKVDGEDLVVMREEDVCSSDLHGLFSRGIGNEDSARGSTLFLQTFHDDAVMKRTNLHGCRSFGSC